MSPTSNNNYTIDHEKTAMFKHDAVKAHKKVLTIQLANEPLLVFHVSFMQIFSSREHNQ